MNWSLVECAQCGNTTLVPGDCVERVRSGESFVLCEACIDGGGVKGALPLRPPDR
jgi:hypothetical protein